MGEEPPHLVRAIKLNVPFYGLTGQGWFAAMAALANYLKISIFAGVDLQPPPPVATASHGEGARTRCLPITSPQDIDERQLLSWLRQTQDIKGWGFVPAGTRGSRANAGGTRPVGGDTNRVIQAVMGAAASSSVKKAHGSSSGTSPCST